jgi:dipeptidyl aminopeptidase/acylaminoacyl peptidase
MYAIRRNNQLLWLLSACLILLLTACSTTPPTTKGTPTPGRHPTTPAHRMITPTIASTTITMPSTQTDCPPTGTARPQVTAPLALGNHQNIIYTLNRGTYDTPTSGALIRYDTQTRQKTVLITVSHAHIYEAQVSADGQWVLFVTTTGSISRQSRLQLLRVDGQGLQTLACVPGYSLQQMQWSTDQHYLVYYNNVNDQGIVYLLDMLTGTLQTELTTPPQVGLLLRTWFDATHIYVSDRAIDTLYTHLYLLDIKKGAMQHLSDLSTVLFQQYSDFDSSDDSSSLFTTDGNCRDDTCNGPSHIVIQPVTGGPQHTIYRSQDYDVIELRAIDRNSVLFIIGNSPWTPDTSHNGLWSMRINGTNLTHLVTTTTQQYSYMNYGSQQPWSNISRDSSMYVIQVNEFQNSIEKHSLRVGSLPGGSAKVFASIADGSQLGVVGWTVM